MKQIPQQYKKQTEAIIYKIGKLSDALYPFISELGDSLEIECDKCIVIIKKQVNNAKKGE